MYRYWSSLTWALHLIWSITWYCFGVLRISLYFVELHWSSYLSGRFQQFVIDGATSNKFDIDFGVPQGSCIGLLLFSIYTGQLLDIVTQHLPTVHCYADDTKLYLAFRPGDRATQDSAVAAMEACIQFIIIGTQAQLKKVEIDNLAVGDSCISLSADVIRNLGAWFDVNFKMNTHVTKNCKTGFFYLHNISRIRKFSRNHGEFNTWVRRAASTIVILYCMDYLIVLYLKCNAFKMLPQDWYIEHPDIVILPLC